MFFRSTYSSFVSRSVVRVATDHRLHCIIVKKKIKL